MSRQSISQVVTWLEELRRAAGAVQRAGLASGANEAARAGLRAVYDADTLHVANRGRRSMDRIPGAMSDGMRREFDRRAR